MEGCQLKDTVILSGSVSSFAFPGLGKQVLSLYVLALSPEKLVEALTGCRCSQCPHCDYKPR